MPQPSDWKLPEALQPKPEDYAFDLDQALSAVVSLRATAPEDGFTAEVLGTERAGNGVVIRDGLILTIGYLIAEAETIWLTYHDGKVAPGHVLAYDHVTGFGLVQPLARVEAPALPLGTAGAVDLGDRVVVVGAGGRAHAVAARIVARQEFAGYWEYLLDQALFTAPAHPHWGGTAVIGPAGELIGIGSLQLEHAVAPGESVNLNMIVPVDLLTPILDSLVRGGRRDRPPRPWLGLYATEIEDNKVVVMGLASAGPARAAGLEVGDIVLAVGGRAVGSLATFFRRVWSLGPAGVEVPLTIFRRDESFEVKVTSADRDSFLKRPSLQ